jgi:tRNA-dihydrouridine synthase A
VFIVHARNAWLKGISPKENRELPPLRHEFVHQLKREFPSLTIVLNGGVKTNAQIAEQLALVDGVMLGREAYHHPWLMADWDARHFAQPDAHHDRDAIEAVMVGYMQRVIAGGEPWSHVSRHMLGLRNGLAGARHWRQVWSDHHRKHETPATVSRHAREAAQAFA